MYNLPIRGLNPDRGMFRVSLTVELNRTRALTHLVYSIPIRELHTQEPPTGRIHPGNLPGMIIAGRPWPTDTIIPEPGVITVPIIPAGGTVISQDIIV